MFSLHLMEKFLNKIKNSLLGKPPFSPVFLIGCGRSGTTILGNTIGQHKEITYLNERRDLWHTAYPELDIWSGAVQNPKLLLGPEDVTSAKSETLKQLFYSEQINNRSTVLLEKLPINNFRLEFIRAIFPEARFIYLHRNGLEVASSIQKKADVRPWFGKQNQKWEMLLALGKNTVTDLPKREFSNFEKGLLEWRLSIDASEAFFSKLPLEKFYSLSYQSFVENSAQQLKAIYQFLNLKAEEPSIQGFVKDISRKSERHLKVENSLLAIGGRNLELSVKNELR